MSEEFDVLILGAGMGASAFASRLAGRGLSICLVDRGAALKQAPENWDPDEVISRGRYDPPDQWYDGSDRPFLPRVYYNLGGSSKFFGATSFRLREADFNGRNYREGKTEPWPISYADLAPWYDLAERAMWVHGQAGSDPTEPPRGDFPYPPLEHEDAIAWLSERLSAQGLQPFPLPIAVNQGPGGHCRKGSPCDGFPCKIRAKGDAENAFLRPALRRDRSIDLRTNLRVEQLILDDSGKRVVGVEAVKVTVATEHGRAVEQPGERVQLRAGTVVLAAGTVNSATILLRSSHPRHQRGVANRSGAVGRHFMSHNNTVLMALHPLRRNPTWFQKTMAINDFYSGGGNIQMRGKVLPQNLQRSGTTVMRRFAKAIAERSFDFWVMSEDLPDAENRVELRADGSIRLTRRLNNLGIHDKLVTDLSRHLRRAGLPIVLRRPPTASAIQHQVGTLRMGHDPERSVVAPDGCAHDLENLYIVDGSVFPSSAAVNPALTIAANALRVADIVAGRLGASPPPEA